MKEIAKEDEEKDKRHLRRMAAKQERLKTRPSRLGKYKYVVMDLKTFMFHTCEVYVPYMRSLCSIHAMFC